MPEIALKKLTPGVVAVGTPWVSDEILVMGYAPGDVSGKRAPQGYFSLDVTHTGGSLTAEIVAANGSTFKTPEGATAILSAKAAGGYFTGFSVDQCRAFKLKLTATSSDCTVSECIVSVG